MACGALLVTVAAFVAGCAGSNAANGRSSAANGTGQPAAAPVNGPRIAIAEDSFDFGKVPLNKVVSHSFKIKNVGTAPLTFLGEPPVRAVQGC